MPVEMQTVNTTQTINQKNPVKQGAKIGAGAALGLLGVNYLTHSHELKKVTGDGFFKTFNRELNIATEACGGNKKTKALMLASFALSNAIFITGVSTLAAGIGAGIGKLVKNHNEKKEAQKQEIVNQVKAELIEDIIN